MLRYLALLVGISSSLALAAIVAAATLAGGASDPGSVTNRGRLIPLAPDALVSFKDRDGTPIRAVALIAERGVRAFYRLDRADGRTCYAVGRGTEQASPGIVTCGPNLLSADRPVVDMSIFEFRRDASIHAGSPSGTLISVAGIAADTVASVEMRDDTAVPLAEIQVTDNVYHSDQIPAGSTSLAFLNDDGAVIHTVP